jgi:hypothetical protein
MPTKVFIKQRLYIRRGEGDVKMDATQSPGRPRKLLRAGKARKKSLLGSLQGLWPCLTSDFRPPKL